jgi:hypothetical protein
MNIAELLRGLADKLDGIEQDGTDDAPKQTGLNPVGDIQGGDTDTTKMVPPLQAKLELLKKATGVDNVYDSEEPDELDDIKKLTGIKAVIAQEAGEDNDITG